MKGRVEGGGFALAAGVLAAAGAAWVVSQAGEILLPFVLAALLAYLVNPAVAFFEARGYSRARLVPALYGGVLLLLVLAAGWLIPLAIETAAAQRAKVPEYMAIVRRLPQELERQAQELPFGGDLAADGIRRVAAAASRSTERVPVLLLGLLPIVGIAGLVVFVSYFALVSGPNLIGDFVRVCPNRHIEKAVSLISQIDRVLGNYLRAIALEAAAVAVLTWIGLVLLKVRFAWEIATLAGLTNMVPYLGPVVGGLGGAAVAFWQFGSLAVVGKVLVLAWLVQLIDNWLVQPAILRHAVELHPVTVLFVLLLGGQLFGFAGLLFAVPACCVLKEAAVVVWEWTRVERGLVGSEMAGRALRIPYI